MLMRKILCFNFFRHCERNEAISAAQNPDDAKMASVVPPSQCRKEQIFIHACPDTAVGAGVAKRTNMYFDKKFNFNLFVNI